MDVGGNYYPESIWKIYAINAPWVFRVGSWAWGSGLNLCKYTHFSAPRTTQACWAIVKPWLVLLALFCFIGCRWENSITPLPLSTSPACSIRVHPITQAKVNVLGGTAAALKVSVWNWTVCCAQPDLLIPHTTSYSPIPQKMQEDGIPIESIPGW